MYSFEKIISSFGLSRMPFIKDSKSFTLSSSPLMICSFLLPEPELRRNLYGCSSALGFDISFGRCGFCAFGRPTQTGFVVPSSAHPSPSGSLLEPVGVLVPGFPPVGRSISMPRLRRLFLLPSPMFGLSISLLSP